MSVHEKARVFEKPGEGWSKGSASSGGAVLDQQDKGDLDALLGSLRSQMASVKTDYKKPASRGVCAGCKKEVPGEMLVARSRSFHPACFSCSSCGVRLGTETFYFVDKTAQFCPKCYNDRLTPQCVACSQSITGPHTFWHDNPYHLKCFTCTSCNAVLDTKEFAVVNNAPHCLQCESSTVADTQARSNTMGRCEACGKAGEDNFCEDCGGKVIR